MKRTSDARAVEWSEPDAVRRRKPMRLRAADHVGKGADFSRVLDVAISFAGEVRLRALVALSFGPMNVSQLVVVTRADQRRVSAELIRMKNLGVVESRREGPFVVISLTQRGRKLLAALVECAAA